jgi:hypothetical protein
MVTRNKGVYMKRFGADLHNEYGNKSCDSRVEKGTRKKEMD